MTLRDQRQAEFAQNWLDYRFGILDLCPRFGKIYTTINILETMPNDIDILIAYPDREIEKSWKNDFKKRGYKNKNITYTTHLSLKKYVQNKYDLVIIDEIHLLSDAQISACKELFMLNREVLGLTGTLSVWTEKILLEELGLGVVGYYPIDLAISEGVVTDYQITVFKVPLDDIKRGMFKKFARTEKKQFNALSWVINEKMKNGESTMFLRLSRMRIIQNSISKLNKTKELLEKHKDERILVFCGVIKVAESLGILAHHSKSKTKQEFEDWTNGIGDNHIAVVKIGNSGVTYKPLNKVIINYFDSNSENLAQKINRCMGMEYDTPDKKAHIYIVCTDEIVEQKWLNKALEFFDDNKIKYVT
jgi:superfamily II DNA or RNA helicase